METWKKLILITLSLIVIFGGLYVYSLSKVTIHEVKVNKLEDISLRGFTVGGELILYNGGILPVSIDHINYDVIIESTGNKLASGYIRGKKIPAKNIASFPFSNRINWVPSAQMALNLIKPGKTYAKISGTVYIADLKFIDFKIPFQKRIDLEVYIRQFVRNQINRAVDKVTTTVTNVVDKVGEGIKSITGSIIDGLGNLFG